MHIVRGESQTSSILEHQVGKPKDVLETQGECKEGNGEVEVALPHPPLHTPAHTPTKWAFLHYLACVDGLTDQQADGPTNRRWRGGLKAT